jgi:radical SAM enzyme (TIGR01210 family)
VTATLSPLRPWLFFTEDERTSEGVLAPVNTIFLTNRKCPWNCVMCDLWKNTLPDTVPLGAIPAQIDHALAAMPEARIVKLYNSGSFFDPHAIPPGDYAAIASRLTRFERIIVECHPALVGANCFRFNSMIAAKLEVAMGLETVNPEVLPRLEKRMTLNDFARASENLRRNDIDLRVFIIVRPPFETSDETALYWACRSLDFAFDCGATAATLIPARGVPEPPSVETMEKAQSYGLSLKRGRVFTDLWDFAGSQKLRCMNLTQELADA